MREKKSIRFARVEFLYLFKLNSQHPFCVCVCVTGDFAVAVLRTAKPGKEATGERKRDRGSQVEKGLLQHHSKNRTVIQMMMEAPLSQQSNRRLLFAMKNTNSLRVVATAVVFIVISFKFIIVI